MRKGRSQQIGQITDKPEKLLESAQARSCSADQVAKRVLKKNLLGQSDQPNNQKCQRNAICGLGRVIH